MQDANVNGTAFGFQQLLLRLQRVSFSGLPVDSFEHTGFKAGRTRRGLLECNTELLNKTLFWTAIFVNLDLQALMFCAAHKAVFPFFPTLDLNE